MSVAARCYNSIDYTKYIDPTVEGLILDRIEALDKLKIASIGATLRQVVGETEKYYTTMEYREHLEDLLLPWVERQKPPVENIDSSSDMGQNVDSGFLANVQEFRKRFGI